ncbi:MAG: Gmad2 immunoglobulin-like domain-containing protein [Nocardioidaceae bacterium]
MDQHRVPGRGAGSHQPRHCHGQWERLRGSVNWQLFDEDGTKVDEGVVTTSMGVWAQADIKLGTLEPGTYTLRCLEYSAEDGHPMNIDDKTFVVE